MANLAALIGVPFEYGGRGPDTFDCYGLVKHCYESEHGIELPDFKSPNAAFSILAMINVQLPLWTSAAKLPGVVALFSLEGVNNHVGYTLQGDRFIHTWEKSGGVCIERLHDWRHRVTGYYQFKGPQCDAPPEGWWCSRSRGHDGPCAARHK